MTKYLILLLVVLLLLCIMLGGKIYCMKKAAKEITREFAEKCRTDTNTLLSVSPSDRDMKRLACALNEQLRILRQKRQIYSHGDAELKKAVTNISHDLRTPLTAISGYLDLLEDEGKSENAEKYLGMIRNRTESMKDLTEELFRFSVITSPENEITKQECDIRALLEQSIADSFTLLSRKGIEPRITLPESRVIRLTDSSAVERIFANILSNAAKYSDGDLTIVLSPDGEVRFTNKAEALSEIQVQRMFDRFYTVNEARWSTGLGLSIAKTLISKTGGEIRAEYRDESLTVIVRV